jgi:HPt (histidine-containing phosphotransfer) domain-containing protein
MEEFSMNNIGKEINIPGIDTNKAIATSGSKELFLELLSDVYKLIDEKSKQIEDFLANANLKDFTITVHSLKTICRMIGATALSEDFFTLEKLGKNEQLEQIKEIAPGIIKSFRALKPYLEPYALTKETARKEFDKDSILSLLDNLLYALNDFNLADAEELTKQVLSYNCGQEISSKFENLSNLVSNLDYDEAISLVQDLREIIKP